MKNFFIGTTNPYKVREIGGILTACDCSFEVTEPLDPEETETDFEGNARLKAIFYAREAGGFAISDDSGLVITALAGLPGPYSARYSDCVFDYQTGRLLQYHPSKHTREEIDDINNKRVLTVMSEVDDEEKREAFFKVALVVATPDGEILFSECGQSRGFIAREERGTNGFGYDKIFIGEDTFGRTYAEIDGARKNLRSHRKAVLDKFRDWLPTFAETAEGSEN